MNYIDYRSMMYSDFFNMQPCEVLGTANTGTQFWKRYLYRKIFGSFKFDLPDNIPKNFFLFWLFKYGSIAVAYTNEFGWVASPYGVSKLDFYYQPKKFTISNPYLKNSMEWENGKNGYIVKLNYDFFGLEDLVTRYAEKLASCDKAIDINLMNANVSIAISATNKKEANEVKAAYAEATTGKPFVALNKDLLNDGSLSTLIKDVKTNYIANEVLESRAKIINEFLTIIGLNNSNNEKKERMVTDEVNANNEDVRCIAELWIENLSEDFEVLTKLTGLKWSVERRFDNEPEPIETEGSEVDA